MANFLTSLRLDVPFHKLTGIPGYKPLAEVWVVVRCGHQICAKDTMFAQTVNCNARQTGLIRFVIQKKPMPQPSPATAPHRNKNAMSISSGHESKAGLCDSVRRSSAFTLYGDIGDPKMSTIPANSPPSGGYYTDLTCGPHRMPTAGWSACYKQPAVRHDRNTRAAMVFCDGHVEKWNWLDLRNDRNDIFARDQAP